MICLKRNHFLLVVCASILLTTIEALTNGDFSHLNHDYNTARRRFNEIRTISVPSPPDHKQYIAMARFVVHQADWVSLATLSNIKAIKGYPFSNVVSMSDGPIDKSTGIPYFYLTPLDFASIDLSHDNRCTVSVTLEETDYCKQQNFDPDDPRCARVMLSGLIVKMDNTTKEYAFAQNALFSRHHSMSTLPKDHGFYVAKLIINHVVMLDWFGGPIYMKVDEYLAFEDDDVNRRFFMDKMDAKHEMNTNLL